jgi:hypothetical protein
MEGPPASARLAEAHVLYPKRWYAASLASAAEVFDQLDRE